MNCLNAATACEGREAQQRQMEQQRQEDARRRQQEAAERQAKQARDAKEITGKQQRVEQAGEIARRVSAEAAIQQQFDAAMEKGMQALDQKGYVTAEYQFKAALKIKPNDIDAKAGLLRAIAGAGRRAAAITYANEQLLALAAQPPGADGRSAYARWLEALSDNGLTNDAERSQLERIYPFGGGDPVGAAAVFPKANPKSSFLPFVRQIGGVMPAMIADYADRRKQTEIKLQTAALAEAKAKDDAEAQGKARAEAEAKAKVEMEIKLAAVKKEDAELRPGKVFKDCADCPEMVVIPAGSFEMGSNDESDEKPVHTVMIGKAFALGKTEVTQRQWRAVMGNDPQELRYKGCDDCPVENVNWNDAQELARTLRQKTGQTYRLPTEAEWEYACRAGGSHTYCGHDSLDNVAWHDENLFFGKTHPVASKEPNAWGLYDMSGNAWEWTEDCWNGSYSSAPGDGSAWTRGDCKQRVLRGGSWFSAPQEARSAKREKDDSSYRDRSVGFRVARMLP
jgi:formylglycine-generating enzyme required for sulfatase activity